MQSRTALAGAAVIAALVVTAGAAGAVATGAVQPDVQPQQSQQAQLSDTITVAGSGTVQAEADRAVIRLGVVATGDDITAVRDQLSENASSMQDALVEMGIDESQIQTAYYDISSQEAYGGPQPEEPTYRGLHAFVVTTEQTDSAGEIIDTAVSSGASQVAGGECALSEDRRQELRQQALEEAMDNARSEASTLAASEDLSITGVDRISTTNYVSSPYQASYAVADGGDAGTSINSGPVTVRASTTVVYDTGS
jgi:uncharacterized protein YggE